MDYGILKTELKNNGFVDEKIVKIVEIVKDCEVV